LHCRNPYLRRCRELGKFQTCGFFLSKLAKREREARRGPEIANLLG
jgi:hypothetical protein